MKVRKFGSILINGEVIQPGDDALTGLLDTKKIDSVEITDAPCPWTLEEEEYKISWVDRGDCLLAASMVCVNIDWKTLERTKFVKGKLVTLNNRSYLCRLPTGGQSKGDTGEWDEFLKEFGNSNDLWRWSAGAFWCKERPDPSNPPTHRVLRGYGAADSWLLRKCNSYAMNIGFRPLLIPQYEPDKPENVVGKQVRVHGPGGFLEGLLEDCDDYDLIFQSKSVYFGPTAAPWINHIGEIDVINRADVRWLEEI